MQVLVVSTHLDIKKDKRKIKKKTCLLLYHYIFLSLLTTQINNFLCFLNRNKITLHKFKEKIRSCLVFEITIFHEILIKNSFLFVRKKETQKKVRRNKKN